MSDQPGLQSDDGTKPFEIRSERIPGDRLCLWISGDIDSAERDLIVDELDGGPAPAEIFIELSEIGHVYSPGIAALIHACRILDGIDERVTLIDPPAQVIRMLEACKISDQFTVQLG